MRKNYLKISFVLVFITIFSYYATLAVAVTTQWFPQIGTRVEHKMSSIVKYDNGTLGEFGKFNVYSSGTNFYIMPKPVDDLMVNYPSLVSEINGTEISIVHSYRDYSSTDLNRTTIYIINNTEYSEKQINWIRHTSDSSMSLQFFRAQSILVKKTNFLTTAQFDFLDYVDNTAGPGTTVVPNYNVLVVTEDHIVVMDTYESPIDNLTHIADRTGKVHTFAFSSSNSIVKSRGMQSFVYILTTDDNPATIPTFPLSFIISFAGLAIILIVKMSVKDKRCNLQ